MSMLNLILININIMDMKKKHILIYLFISMLVSNKSEIGHNKDKR
jgi:hypothetical protein